LRPFTCSRSRERRARRVVHNRRSMPTAALLALVSGTALAVGLTEAPVGASEPASPSSPSNTCAWPWTVGVRNYNVSMPDSGAADWFQPIVAGQETSITISGTYPDARYFSLSVYTPYGTPVSVDGVSSSLSDYRVVPDHGSVNPWQRLAAPGGRYQVTVRSGVAPGERNALPFPVGTTSLHPGYLHYRVYLPAGGDFAGIKLPTIGITKGSTSHTLPACRTHGQVPAAEKAPGGTPRSSPPTTPPPDAFFKSRLMNGFDNVDAAYVGAYVVRPAPTQVLVVTAKAPTFPTGSHPSPWPAPGVDMRYWSMCIGVGTRKLPTVANKLPDGPVDYGCRADQETKVNAAGDYAYVIGSETQRAAISRVAGATFLPFSDSQTTPLYLLWLRNYLVNAGFAHSAEAVGKPDDAAAAAAAMGPYYPRVSTCALATLTTKGLSACETH
jgi:hypothetical protein